MTIRKTAVLGSGVMGCRIAACGLCGKGKSDNLIIL
jgi:3-hydroxyacyl-CoA dehydrogenase